MSNALDKPLSLIERKKQQWAREKDELAGLSAPWAAKSCDGAFQRVRTIPKLPLNNELFRRSSLPPLCRSLERDMGGEQTSGYGSDNPNVNQSGYESSSSFKEDRPKWHEKTKYWAETEPPNWVKRGLQTDEEIIVASSSPSESPQQDDDSEGAHPGFRSFLRGQNIQLDATEVAERERKRQVALAHQSAIREQLEERERKRAEDKARRIKEELEEELRIEREQDIERKRKEDELRLIAEKQHREQKRNEALNEALSTATKAAKLDKVKQKMMRQSLENINENVVIHNNLEEEAPVEAKQTNLQQSNEGAVKAPFQVLTPRTDLALVLQGPELANMQYAVLLPTPSNYPATPLLPFAAVTLSPEKKSVGMNTTAVENRLLTPTQYRQRGKVLCEASTQTDDLMPKLSNLELGGKKERRGKNDEEKKPQWGANRPPTRYLTQSEKDPFYQRRKSRQSKDYKNSSDESQGSPRSYRRKTDKRHSRAQWRANEHFFTRNIRMYQTEIVPLDSDKEYIHYRHKCCQCSCRKRDEVSKSEVLKLERSPRSKSGGFTLDELASLVGRSPRTPSLSSSTRNTENN